MKRLHVETDGDTYPKDVYLVQGGQRVATIEGHNQIEMLTLAKEICVAYNAKHNPQPPKLAQ